MADKYTRLNDPVVSDDPLLSLEDPWKDVDIEKEHQPEKEKSKLTYRSMEQDVEGINSRITTLTTEKEALEAEMVKVKTAAEA